MRPRPPAAAIRGPNANNVYIAWASIDTEPGESQSLRRTGLQPEPGRAGRRDSHFQSVGQ